MIGWSMRVALLATLGCVLGAGYASRIPAADDHANVAPGDEVVIDVLANDGALGPDLTLLRVRGASLGSAVVDGNQVRYTAAEGASGRDQLSYTVRRANGQVAAGRIFVTVEPATIELTLRGWFANVEPTCDLAVIIGSQRFEACTTAGTFEVDISSSDMDSVVVIEATAQPLDIQDSYRFATVLGSLPRLAELAEQTGFPGTLDWGGFGHLRLQEYTTMHHAQLVAAGGPGVFASEAALAQVQKDLDAQRLHALALTFRAARRGWVSLPADIEDPYALAFDLPAFEAFYNAAMPPVFEQAAHELVNQADIQMPWQLPGQEHTRIGLVLGSMGAAPGNINVPFLEGRQVVLEPFGPARAYHPQNADDSTAVWSADGKGRIDVSESAPARQAATITINCGGSLQSFIMHQAIRLERVQRVIQTAHSDVSLFLTETRFVNYDEIPPGCTTVQNEVTRASYAMQTFGNQQLMPIGAQATPGRWAMRLPAPTPGSLAGANGELNAGIVDFGAGTVDAPGLAPTMGVSTNADNGLDLSFQTSGQGAAPIDMQIFRTRSDGRGGEQWLGNADGGDMGSLGLGGLAARETHPDLFDDASQALGAWRSAFAVVTAGRHSASPTELIFELSPENPGQGVRHQILENGARSQMPFGWEVDDAGRVVMTTWYSRVTLQLVPVCVDDCYVLQRRTWQPVSLVDDAQGKRLYVIEEILHGNANNEDIALLSRRVNFYDATVAPDRAPAEPQAAPARARLN